MRLGTPDIAMVNLIDQHKWDNEWIIQYHAYKTDELTLNSIMMRCQICDYYPCIDLHKIIALFGSQSLRLWIESRNPGASSQQLCWITAMPYMIIIEHVTILKRLGEG